MENSKEETARPPARAQPVSLIGRQIIWCGVRLASRVLLGWLSVLFPKSEVTAGGTLRYRKHQTTEIWIEAQTRKLPQRDALKTKIRRKRRK
jgi:hypothetical protein